MIYDKLHINIFNNDICNNTLSENEKPHFINYKQQLWNHDFAAISQERIIFPEQLCYLSSCKYITSYGWHSVSPVAMNRDPIETQLSYAKHLNYLQRLILSHACTSWTFFSVIRFVLGCPEMSISQSLMHTTAWELVLVGIQEWTSDCVTHSFLSHERSIYEYESHSYLTAIVTKSRKQNLQSLPYGPHNVCWVCKWFVILGCDAALLSKQPQWS